MSNLLQNLFEFAETTKPALPADSQLKEDDPERPFLALATFRMCILTDALLEEFFESDLTQSWRLEVLVPEEKPKPQTRAGGWWGGLVEAVMTDENKVNLRQIFRTSTASLTQAYIAGTVQPTCRRGRETFGHSHRGAKSVVPFQSLPLSLRQLMVVLAGPSIGKLDAAAAAIEPQARDTLFSTSTARKQSSPLPVAEHAINPLSAAAMRMPAYPTSENPWADAAKTEGSSGISIPQHDIDVQALAQAALQRPQFADDAATEGEGEEYVGPEGDDGLLGQVDAMLQADEQAGAGWSLLAL